MSLEKLGKNLQKIAESDSLDSGSLLDDSGSEMKRKFKGIEDPGKQPGDIAIEKGKKKLSEIGDKVKGLFGGGYSE